MTLVSNCFTFHTRISADDADVVDNAGLTVRLSVAVPALATLVTNVLWPDTAPETNSSSSPTDIG